jgi:hypothetical protein
MRSIFAFIGCLWALLSTGSVCFFSLLEGQLDLKAKPLWVVGIMLLLGAITAMACMESLFPLSPIKVKRKTRSIPSSSSSIL